MAVPRPTVEKFGPPQLGLGVTAVIADNCRNPRAGDKGSDVTTFAITGPFDARLVLPLPCPVRTLGGGQEDLLITCGVILFVGLGCRKPGTGGELALFG